MSRLRGLRGVWGRVVEEVLGHPRPGRATGCKYVAEEEGKKAAAAAAKGGEGQETEAGGQEARDLD